MKKIIFTIVFISFIFLFEKSFGYNTNFLNLINKTQEIKFENKENIKTLEIAFGGDIMLSRTVGYKNKRDGYDKTFVNFDPNKDFSNKTLLFYNLESPFSKKDNDILKRTFVFKANTRNMEVINNLRKKKNKLVLSLANNHITNAGIEGVNLTIDLLDKNNIFHIGVSKSERIPYKKINNNGVNVCINGYTYDGRNINTKNETYFINKVTEENIIKDLEEMKKDDCEFKIISLHWGSEYAFKANKNQRQLAHKIIDSGADLILGHHSHILGEIENYKGKYIYYSLGNFIFDQNWGKNETKKGFHYIYDEKLKRKTVPTYIGNTFYHKYEFSEENTSLVEIKNIKHRIDNGILSEY